MKNIRYAIFDMDGTLVDSMGRWLSLIDECFQKLFPNTVIPEYVKQEIQTLGVAGGADYIRSLHLSPETDAYDENVALSLMLEHYRHDIALREGVLPLLDALRANGTRLAIATLTPYHMVEACLAKHGILSYFEFFHTSDNYPEGKREPRIFLDAIERFGASADEVWLFEDSLYSCRTAKGLGMRIVATEDAHQRHNFEKLYAISDMYFQEGFLKRLK
jgi:HAD superfamily hydrolase (TIGR01509 family)